MSFDAGNRREQLRGDVNNWGITNHQDLEQGYLNLEDTGIFDVTAELSTFVQNSQPTISTAHQVSLERSLYPPSDPHAGHLNNMTWEIFGSMQEPRKESEDREDVISETTGIMQNNMIGEGAYGGLGGASLQGFYGYDQTQPINSSLGLGNAPNRDEMGISGLWVTEPQGGMGQDNTHGSLTLENMAFDDNAHASALSSAPSSTLVQLLHPTYELPGARPDDECGQQWPQATDTNLEPVSGVLDTAVVNATSQSLAEFPAQPFQGWNYQDSDGISEANTFAASTSAHEGLELLFSTPSNPARYSAPPGLNDRAYSAIHQLQPKPRAAGASTLSSDAVLSVTQVHTPLSTLSPPATSNALGAPFASARVSLSRRTGQYHGNGEARRRESAVERQRRLDARRFEQRQRFREEPGSTLAYSQDNVKPHHGPNKRRRTGHA